LSNYVFENKNNFEFENVTSQWGLDEKSFSNGAAYGDFDLDGDLDLVINNIDSKAMLYKNMAS